jgi:peptide/nickel transport system substrate-binding protein
MNDLLLHGLKRRDLLKYGSASLLALGAAPSALAAAPNKGGQLRLGLAGGSTSDALDPATWTATFMLVGMMGGVCNNLAEVDADGKITPELAESWESSKDAKTWTFKLRPGVEFHNGKTLEAADVVASYNHHRGAATKSGAKGVMEPIANIRADGKNIVVFELKGGNADFPFVTADYHMSIFPAKDSGIDWASGVGTGGYKLVNFEPGVRMVLKRQPNYWKAGHGNFDDVELLGIADAAARMNALVTGQVDVINRADLKTINLLKRRPGIVVESVTGPSHYCMPMLCDVPPFNDVNVRLALKYGIDRKALVDTLLRGYGAVANDQPISPANRFFNKDLQQRAYDPEQARHYLKKAGLDSLTVDLHAADAAFEGAVDAAVLFREQASKAGLNINVVREPNDGYWSNVWRVKPFVMSFWLGRPTEDSMFSLVYAKGAEWNEAHWDNERFNQLLVQARAELDESKRREMYYEMQALVRDDGGTIIPMYANFVDARSEKVAHGKLAADRELDGWKVVDRWWVA